MAQRLVRRLCSHCRRPHEPQAVVRDRAAALQKQFPTLFVKEPQWFEARGCPKCQNTGYRGRLGIYEMAVVTDEVAEMVQRQRPLHEIQAEVRKTGFRDLLEDGLLKAWQGETSAEEVLRVAGQAGIEDG
jgi:general secretion pathway protein E